MEGLMKVQLATRLDTGLRQRLRVYAAVTGRTVEDVVTAALDGYLPRMGEMVQGAGNDLRRDALLAEQPGMARHGMHLRHPAREAALGAGTAWLL